MARIKVNIEKAKPLWKDRKRDSMDFKALKETVALTGVLKKIFPRPSLELYGIQHDGGPSVYHIRHPE